MKIDNTIHAHQRHTDNGNQRTAQKCCGERPVPSERPRKCRGHNRSKRNEDRDITCIRVIDRTVLQKLIAEYPAESHCCEQPLITPSTLHLGGVSASRRLPRSGRYERCVSPAQPRTDFPSPQRHPRQPKPPDQNLKRREILQQCPRIGKRHSPNEDHKSGNKTSTAQRIFYAGWRG